MRLAILLLMMVLLVPAVFALQVSPAQQTITSSEETTFTFTIRAESQEPVTIRLEGALEEYARAPATILPTSNREELLVTINPPDNLTPGRHDLNIILSQRASTGGNVAATAEIMPTITYVKTYAGSFLEPIIRPINNTHPLSINVLLQNLGEEELLATTTFNIAQTRSVKEEVFVPAATNSPQRYSINTTKGEHTLTTTIHTLRQEFVDEQQVQVGVPTYDVVSIQPGRLQDIVPITVLVGTDWNVAREETIRPTILANGTRHDLEEQITTLDPNTNTLEIFWEDATLGEHELLVRIGDQEITQPFIVQESSRLQELLPASYLVILVIVLLLLSVWQLKKRHKKH